MDSWSVKGTITFSSCGKNEARSLTAVTALCCLQCFDTARWVMESISGHKIPSATYPRNSPPEQMEEENPGELDKPGSCGNWPLKQR